MSEHTTKIPHPNFPEFICEIRYVGRIAASRIAREVEKAKRPFAVLNPGWRPGEDEKARFVRDAAGALEVAWRVDSDDELVRKQILAYLIRFDGLSIRGEAISFDPATVDILHDETLDVPFTFEVDDGNGKGGKKQVTATESWTRRLSRLSQDITTFFPVPSQPSSAAP